MATVTITDLLSPELVTNDANETKDLLKADGNNYKEETTDKHENGKDGVHLKNRFSLKAWEKRMGFKTDLIWRNVILISMYHIVAVSWVVYKVMIGDYPKWQSILYVQLVGWLAGFGVTAGVHRLWTHRSYKASVPLQWFLAICFSIAGQLIKMATVTITDLLSPELVTNDANETKDLLKADGNNYKEETTDKHENGKDGVHLKNRFSLKAWEKRMGFKTDLIWRNVILISMYHIVAVSWVVYKVMIGDYPKWQSILYVQLVGWLAGFGVTAGVHRLWTHRSYKASVPLQWFLAICFSIAGQNTIPDWVRDHRVHHKFSDTLADPHDISRGIFFSHVGWLMMKKHPEVLRNGRKIDMSDIDNNPVVQFHTRHFVLFKLAFCFVLPTLVPRLWGESWSHAVLSQVFVRYVLSLNYTWAVNSFAHFYGNRPYDPNMKPAENWVVSLVAMGEGWHNYHHAFPWDYKAAELPYALNLTTLMLDGFAAIGWASDMKKASPELIQTVSKNRKEL